MRKLKIGLCVLFTGAAVTVLLQMNFEYPTAPAVAVVFAILAYAWRPDE